MKPDLVSPDFLLTFGFTFGKHTGNISISEIAISNLLRKSNVSIKSSLILQTTNVVLELVTRAGNLFQSPLVPQDECHKKFTRPYVILLVLHQIATEYF